MSENGLGHVNPCPSFQRVKQMSMLWLQVKGIEKEERHAYIILWSGTEGMRLYNYTWQLTTAQLKDPKNL